MTLKKGQDSNEETQLLEGPDPPRKDSMIVPTLLGNGDQNKDQIMDPRSLDFTGKM